MDDAYPPDPALDVVFVLIAELHRAGVIDDSNLASMARRLGLADLPDLAERLQAIPLSNAVDTPEAIQAGLHLVRDGGNEAN